MAISRPHIDLIVESLKELYAEAAADDKRPKPLGMRALFVGVLQGNGNLEKTIAEVRKRMRGRQ